MEIVMKMEGGERERGRWERGRERGSHHETDLILLHP